MKGNKLFLGKLIVGFLLSTGTAGSVFAAATQEAAAADEPMVITAMMMQHPNNPWTMVGDSIVFQELEKRTGIDFEWQGVPAGDYPARLSIVMATGEFPDLIQIFPKEGQVYGLQGAFEPVNELARMYAPTYYAAIQDPINRFYNADEAGDIYTVASLMDPQLDMGEAVLGYVFVDYRKDILEDMGETEPTTLEEWKALWRKVKEEGGLIPVTTRWRGWLYQFLINMTGIVHEPQYNTFLENDVYHYGPIDDRARWVVEQLHELYDEGLLDQEFATIQHAQWEERVTAGQAFSMIEGFGRIDWANGLGRELNPDYTMWGAWPVQGPFGVEPKVVGGYIGPGLFANQPGWGINPKISDEKKQAIMSVVEFLSSPEGSELTTWGVEGETFAINNGKREYIVENPSAYGVRTSYGVWPVVDAIYMESYDAANRPRHPEGQHAYDNISLKMATKPHPPVVFNTAEAERIGELWAAINTLQLGYYDKFTVGTLDIDSEWDTFISDIEDAGVEEFMTIMNTAYQRQKAFFGS